MAHVIPILTELNQIVFREQIKYVAFSACFNRKIIKCEFRIFAGLRRPVYFQYEMGTADTVSRTVDALLNDWAQIVHLYSIVHDLAEYFKMGALHITIKSHESHNLRLIF